MHSQGERKNWVISERGIMLTRCSNTVWGRGEGCVDIKWDGLKSVKIHSFYGLIGQPEQYRRLSVSKHLQP